MSTTISVLIIIIAFLLIIAFMILAAMTRQQKQQRILSSETKPSKSASDKSGNTKLKAAKPKEEYFIQIAKLKKLLTTSPDDADAREQLGDCHIAVAAYTAAVKEYQTILNRKTDLPDNVRTRITCKLGQAYMSLVNYNEAQKCFRIVWHADPQNVDALVNLGIIAIKTGSPEKGLAVLKKAREADPSSTSAAKFMGIAHYMMHNYAASVSCLSFCDKLSALDAEGLLYYGVSLYMTQASQANYYLRQAARDASCAGEAQYWLGRISCDSKDSKQAIQFFSAAVSNKSLKPSLILDAYYKMGDIYIDMRDSANAVKCWSAIAERQKDYKDVAQKLQVYGNRNSSENTKIYITGTPTQFADLCRRFASFYVERSSNIQGGVFSIRDATSSDDGCYTIIGDYRSDEAKESFILLFIRDTGIISDVSVRSVHKIMRDNNIDKAVCISCGSFNDAAKDFVSARMITLLEEDDTNAILKQI